MEWSGVACTYEDLVTCQDLFNDDEREPVVATYILQTAVKGVFDGIKVVGPGWDLSHDPNKEDLDHLIFDEGLMWLEGFGIRNFTTFFCKFS